MRSYGQYCALARSLDIVGDRWTLLIIRELFARESRYSDLRDGLPGIATNLLADRLRQLQEEGVIESYDAPPPVRATVYRLTPRGRELGPVLRSLVEWGMPLLTPGLDDDEFRPQWMVMGLRILYDNVDLTGIGDVTIVIDDPYEPITVEVADDDLAVSLGRAATTPTVELEGNPHDLYLVLSGRLESHTTGGVTVDGPDEEIARFHYFIDRVRDSQAAVSR